MAADERRYIINVVVGMYYSSYSLPAYETIMNPEAFARTTIVPGVLMFVFIGYLIVMFFDFRRIKKIPMDQALKNVE